MSQRVKQVEQASQLSVLEACILMFGTAKSGALKVAERHSYLWIPVIIDEIKQALTLLNIALVGDSMPIIARTSCALEICSQGPCFVQESYSTTFELRKKLQNQSCGIAPWIAFRSMLAG